MLGRNRSILLALVLLLAVVLFFALRATISTPSTETQRNANSDAKSDVATRPAPLAAAQVEATPELESARAAALEAASGSAGAITSAPRILTVKGHVCDRVHQPLRGALVRVLAWRESSATKASSDEGWNELAGLPPDTAGASDGSGSFSIGLSITAPESSSVELRMDAGANERVARSFVALAGPGASLELGDIALSGSGTIGGQVRNRDNQLGIGAQIEVARRDPDASDEEREYKPLGRSQDDGNYSFDGIREGRLAVHARLADQRVGQAREISLRAGEARLDVDLLVFGAPDGSTIGGIVLGAGGEPLAHASVVATAPGARGGMVSFTEDDGRFWTQSQRGEVFDLRVSDAQHLFAEQVLSAVPRGTHELVIQLQVGSRLPLRVVDHTGAPVTSFVWRILSSARPSSLAEARVTSAANGETALPVVSEDFFVAVEAAGEVPVQLGPFAPAELPARVEVVLGSAPGLIGRVLRGGVPVADARVRLRATSPGNTSGARNSSTSPAERRASPEQRNNSSAQRNNAPAERNASPAERNTARVFVAKPRDARTDAYGRFGMLLPAPGEYRLFADAPGAGAGEAGPFSIASNTLAAITIELQPYGILEGRVVDENGHPANGKVVVAAREGDEPVKQFLEPSGGFRFSGLAAGHYLVRALEASAARTPSRLPALATGDRSALECDVRAGSATRVELVLAPPTVVNLRIAIEPAPPGGWECTLALPQEPGNATHFGALEGTGPDAQGRWRFESALQGKAQVIVRGVVDDWQIHSMLEIEIVPGGREIVVDPPLGNLTLVRAEDAPSGTSYSLSSQLPGGFFQASLQRPAHAREHVPIAFAGTLRVHRNEGSGKTSKQTELAPGAETVLDGL